MAYVNYGKNKIDLFRSKVKEIETEAFQGGIYSTPISYKKTLPILSERILDCAIDMRFFDRDELAIEMLDSIHTAATKIAFREFPEDYEDPTVKSLFNKYIGGLIKVRMKELTNEGFSEEEANDLIDLFNGIHSELEKVKKLKNSFKKIDLNEELQKTK